MFVKEAEIRNFASIKEIHLENLGNIVVLVGPNSSGKTNILKAIKFALTHPPQTFLEFPNHHFYRNNPENKLKIQVTIGLTVNEMQKLVGKDFYEKYTNKLTRQIRLEVESVNSRTRISKIHFSRFILFDGRKTNDFQKYISRGITDNAVNQDFVNSILSTISKIVLIPGVRKFSRGSPKPNDISFKPDGDGMANYLFEANTNRRFKKMSYVRGTQFILDELFGFDFEVGKDGDSVDIFEDDIPSENIGDGFKQLVVAYSQLNDANKIICIDEIEAHLHPKALKIVIDDLTKNIDEKQLFLSTHSNELLTHIPDPRSIVRVRNLRNTSAYQLKSDKNIDLVRFKKDLKPWINELFFAKSVVFTEGFPDKIVYEKFYEILGRNDVSFIPSCGKDHISTLIMIANAYSVENFSILDRDVLYDDKNPRQPSVAIKNIASEIGIDDKITKIYKLEDPLEIITQLKSFGIFILPKGELEDYIGKSKNKELNAIRYASNLSTQKIDKDFENIIKEIDELHGKKEQQELEKLSKH